MLERLAARKRKVGGVLGVFMGSSRGFMGSWGGLWGPEGVYGVLERFGKVYRV